MLCRIAFDEGVIGNKDYFKTYGSECLMREINNKGQRIHLSIPNIKAI